MATPSPMPEFAPVTSAFWSIKALRSDMGRFFQIAGNCGKDAQLAVANNVMLD
jgi:hypothetical protein